MYNITINDNNITSTLNYEESQYPAPIFVRFKYDEGILTLERTDFEYSNLTSTLGYTLNTIRELNFNFDEYNSPDSITITNGVITITLDSTHKTGTITNGDISIIINRTLGLPLIFKSREGEVLSTYYFSGAVQISVNNNEIISSSGATQNYEDDIEDKTRESVSGYFDEITGATYTGTHSFNSNKAIILIPEFSLDYMEIIFYKSTAEKNILNKIPYLTEYFRCNGVLKEGTSIINPVILIDFNLQEHQDIFTPNYCYIAKFHRYYYIEDITSLYLNLYQVRMKVDVLTTYKTNIYALSGMIKRNEFVYNPDLVDEKMNQEIDYQVDIQEYSNSLFTYTDTITTCNYIIVLAGKGN